MKMVYSYRNIAWIYEVRKEYVNAARYAKMGMSLLKQDSLSPVYSSLAHFLGEQEKRQGNYVKAVEFFHSALKNEQVSTLIPYYNLSLGDAYLQLGQLERAEMYVRNALSSEDCYTQSGAYHYLYLLEKKRAEYAKALLYKEKSDSLQKIAQEMNLQHKIFEIQQKMRQINWWWRINCLCKKSRFSYILAATVFILYSCGICSISGNKKTI